MTTVHDVIVHCQKQIKKEPPPEKLLHYLRRLNRLRITIDDLRETGVGKTVNQLSRLEGEVGQYAGKIVEEWKAMVETQNGSESDEDKDKSATDEDTSDTSEESEPELEIDMSHADAHEPSPPHNVEEPSEIDAYHEDRGSDEDEDQEPENIGTANSVSSKSDNHDTDKESTREPSQSHEASSSSDDDDDDEDDSDDSESEHEEALTDNKVRDRENNIKGSISQINTNTLNNERKERDDDRGTKYENIIPVPNLNVNTTVIKQEYVEKDRSRERDRHHSSRIEENTNYHHTHDRLPTLKEDKPDREKYKDKEKDYHDSRDRSSSYHREDKPDKEKYKEKEKPRDKDRERHYLKDDQKYDRDRDRERVKEKYTEDDLRHKKQSREKDRREERDEDRNHRSSSHSSSSSKYSSEKHIQKRDKEKEKHRNEEKEKFKEHRNEEKEKFKEHRNEEKEKFKEHRNDEKEKIKEHRNDEKEKIKEHRSEEREKTKEYRHEEKVKTKEYRHEEREKSKEYRHEEKDKIKEYRNEEKLKSYRHEDKEKVKDYRQEEKSEKIKDYRQEEKSEKMKDYRQEEKSEKTKDYRQEEKGEKMKEYRHEEKKIKVEHSSPTQQDTNSSLQKIKETKESKRSAKESLSSSSSSGHKRKKPETSSSSGDDKDRNAKKQKVSNIKIESEEIDSTSGLNFADVLGCLDVAKSTSKNKKSIVASTSSSSSGGSKSLKKSSIIEPPIKPSKIKTEHFNGHSTNKASESKNKNKPNNSAPTVYESYAPPVLTFQPPKPAAPLLLPSDIFTEDRASRTTYENGLMSSTENMNEYDTLSSMMSSRKDRTKVYSGNKTGYVGEIPSLFNMCIRVIQENLDSLGFTGGVPYDIIKPALARASVRQLANIEFYNPYLQENTDELWKFICQKECRGQKPQELESYRELYYRCQDERQERLKLLSSKVKKSTELAQQPLRKAKLAYVEPSIRGPRFNKSKAATIKNGMKTLKHREEKGPKTGGPSYSASAGGKNSGTVNTTIEEAAIIISSDSRAGSAPAPSVSRDYSSSSSSAKMKPRKAPLMQKTLKLIKSVYRR